LRNGKAFSYLYDFGDDWHVRLIPEGEATGGKYPALVGFGGCMAAEDCGGADGIEELIQSGEAQEVDQDSINFMLQEIFLEFLGQ
jgi:hypothetical protein